MPKLPVISGKELIKVFEKIGFVFIRQKGSHVIMKHQDNRVVTIPLQKEIKKGTLKKGILNPLNISVKQLIEILKK
ncbi:MAG: type II toxin-antitoxin system HicA family toxin [Patescibacteria group bacterium]